VSRLRPTAVARSLRATASAPAARSSPLEWCARCGRAGREPWVTHSPDDGVSPQADLFPPVAIGGATFSGCSSYRFDWRRAVPHTGSTGRFLVRSFGLTGSTGRFSGRISASRSGRSSPHGQSIRNGESSRWVGKGGAGDSGGEPVSEGETSARSKRACHRGPLRVGWSTPMCSLVGLRGSLSYTTPPDPTVLRIRSWLLWW
jgi:hypothetical protein